jgi:hypothetical protein
MRRAAALLALILGVAEPPAVRAATPEPGSWPLSTELMIAADAASYAPPDLKRQLAKHRARLMAGVKDAAAADRGTRDVAARRAAAARGAREIAQAIRRHSSFADVAYEAGGLVHEIATAAWTSAGGFPAADAAAAPKAGRFLGYSATPSADPDLLAASLSPAKGAPASQAYDDAVTVSTRLLAWIWRTAGGDASITSKHPDSAGPYPIRGD